MLVAAVHRQLPGQAQKQSAVKPRLEQQSNSNVVRPRAAANFMACSAVQVAARRRPRKQSAPKPALEQQPDRDEMKSQPASSKETLDDEELKMPARSRSRASHGSGRKKSSSSSKRRRDSTGGQAGQKQHRSTDSAAAAAACSSQSAGQQAAAGAIVLWQGPDALAPSGESFSRPGV